MFPINGRTTADHSNRRWWSDDDVSGETTALLRPDEATFAAVGIALPSRSAKGLDRALRIATAGPRPFYRAALVSLAVTSTLAMAIGAFTRPPGPLPETQRQLVAHGLVALCVSTALGLASFAAGDKCRPMAWFDRVVARQVRAAIWLALAAWFPFLLVVVYYRAKATFPLPVRYVYFPFDDKRWETAEYLLGVLAPMLWVALAARVLTVARHRPLTWWAWFAGLFPRFTPVAPTVVDLPVVDLPRVARAPLDPPPVGRRWDGARRWLATGAGLATALGLAWYFLGPPWHISQTTAPISKQEDVVLIGLQAVAEGHLPYVGVASVQYGPGTQLAAYLLMRHVTAMSVVGFREAWALFTWAGASILFAVFFLAFGYVRGLAASLLSVLIYPALRQIAFTPGGSFSGYWGWANPLRYVGVIALVLLLPAVVRRCPSWRGAAAGAAIGTLWGLTSYLAQENLAGGAVGALAVGALLLLTSSASWRAVRTALGAVAAGFALIWTPVLAFYAVHRQLAAFLKQYLLFPRAVAGGANDIPWGGFQHASPPYTSMFHHLPLLLAACALLAVFQIRPLRVATEWSRERQTFAVTVLATALLYQGVLLRSDPAHLTGTLLMVPGLVVVAGTALPREFGAKRRVTVVVVCAVVFLASCKLLPKPALAWPNVRAVAEAPYLDRQRLAAGAAPDPSATVAGRRVGPGLDDASSCCQGTPASMPAFIALMNRVHAIIGNRTAYVAGVHGGYPGLVYFVADLNPAPVSSDPYSSIETEPELRAFMADFRTRVVPQTQALFTPSLQAPEARYFLQRYTNARRVTLHFDRSPYYILLRRD